MNDYQRDLAVVRRLYKKLEPDTREIVDIYVDHLRKLLADSPDMHLIYTAIALDLLSAERFTEWGKPQ